MRAIASAALLAASLVACAPLRTMTAPSDDAADYRAFRLAAHPGARLQRAAAYLRAHPRGTFAEEVRAAFDAEEPTYFEAAKASRARTRDYLVFLPRGPHADAAVALLTAFDTHLEELASQKLLREARRTEAMLETAAVQRRAVGETILADLAALLDRRAYGVPRDDVPKALARALGGPAPQTWGALPLRREEDCFFSLPTRPERESRLVTVALEVSIDHGVVVAGTIAGDDLFVRWMEADEMRSLDPSDAHARADAAAHARERIGGALEATLPASRCIEPAGPSLLLARACDGFRVHVVAAAAPGAPDVISVRGPSSLAASRPLRGLRESAPPASK